MKMIRPRMSKPAVLAAMIGVCVAVWSFNVSAALTNLALNKTVVTSSNENNNMIGSKIVDGDTATKWGSNWALYPDGDVRRDSAWFYIDFGAEVTFDSIHILWEHSAAKEYKIQHSNVPSTDDQGWITDTAITGEVYPWPDDGHTPLHRSIKFATQKTARYLKVRCTKRNFQWGFSMWEMRVFNTLGSNLALHKTAVASTSDAAPSLAVDGIMFTNGALNFGSRWENNYGDGRPDSLKGNDWIYVDLGAKYTVKYIAIFWEHSGSGDYVLQAWTKAGTPTAADADWTLLLRDTTLHYSKPPDFSQTAFAVPPTQTQYVRMHSYKRLYPPSEFAWGISIFEFEVYGTSTTSTQPVASKPQSPASGLTLQRTKSGVSFKSSSSSALTVDIFSISGKLVNRIIGTSSAMWNYRDFSGRNVMNGTYLVRVTAAGKSVQEKIAVYR
jgi:hypothetical protein